MIERYCRLHFSFFIVNYTLPYFFKLCACFFNTGPCIRKVKLYFLIILILLLHYYFQQHQPEELRTQLLIQLFWRFYHYCLNLKSDNMKP